MSVPVSPRFSGPEALAGDNLQRRLNEQALQVDRLSNRDDGQDKLLSGQATLLSSHTATLANHETRLYTMSLYSNVTATALLGTGTDQPSNPRTEICMPVSGSLAYLTAKVHTAAITSGTITWYGVTSTNGRLSGTLNSTTSSVVASAARGVLPFAAGTTLAIMYTSNAVAQGTGGGYQVSLWVWV